MPTDSNKQSFELIEYKLDTLMSTVSNGFTARVYHGNVTLGAGCSWIAIGKA